jgi:GT2 family glycosyltransferase
MADRVLAVVLTFDAPNALARCLAAIAAQQRRPDGVLVVDNASPAPVDGLIDVVPGGRVRRLPENVGPAGGYAVGLDDFLGSDYDWAWVMDDDCAPAPDALLHELIAARHGEVALATMVDATTGGVTNTQGWCAVLLPRAVVATVGVPDADLFWWNEDTEYLQWRIPRAGFTVVRSADARVAVSRARDTLGKPAWKYYYEARNQVYYRLHTQRPRRREPVERFRTRRVRWGRAARSVSKLATRAVVREHEQHLRKVAAVARGTRDGIAGRLGRTVPADVADRPRLDATRDPGPLPR